MKKIIQLISVILMACFLFSCNTSKRIERKDQEALYRVEAKIKLLNHAGNEWQKLNPCYPDTIRIGKVVTVIDSSYAKENIESLNNIIAAILSSYPNQNIDSLKEAIRKEVEAKCKPKTVYEHRVDTLPRDKRFENSLRDRIEYLNNQTSNLEGQNTQLEKDKSELKKENKTLQWWLIGVSVFSFLLTGGLTYLLFKK